MYNISTLEEARTMLANDQLSPEEVRELLLYFVQRDDEVRETIQRLGLIFSSLAQLFPPILTSVGRIIPPEDVTSRRQLEEAFRLLTETVAVLMRQPVLQ